MKEQNNKLTLSVITTLTLGISLIYTLMLYPNLLFVVISISILFILSSYFLTKNIIYFSIMKNKSLDTHIKESMHDISNQLELINSAQSQIGKATYLYTKEASKSISTLENHYTATQSSLFKTLTAFSEFQNKSTKLLIKYDQNNTNKIISTMKDMGNHINETLIHGFDQTQSKNDDILTLLSEIVTYFKSNSDHIDQTIGQHLNNLANELQNISNHILQNQITALNTDSCNPEKILVEIEPSPKNTVEQTNLVSENGVSETNPIQEEILADNEAIEIETTSIPEENSNDKLSPDEIAALFAAAEPTPNKENKLDSSAIINDSSVKETDNSTISTIGDFKEDPNKQLSQDEIAALFDSLG